MAAPEPALPAARLRGGLASAPSRAAGVAAGLAGKDPQFLASAGTPLEHTAASHHASCPPVARQNLPCLLQPLARSPRFMTTFELELLTQVKTEQPAIHSSLKSG